MAVTRRMFMKSSGLAMVGFAAIPSFLRRAALAAPLAASADRPVLIVLFQRGAADGMSMVVPFGDPGYYAARPQIALPAPRRGDASSALDLDGFFGLHPALRSLKPIYDAGHLAAVHAVGSPDSTRSHFDAQDFMESGTPGVKSTPDGWLNRLMQERPAPKDSPFRAVALARSLPRALLGAAPAVAMTSIAGFGVRGGGATGGFEELYADGTEGLLGSAGRETFDAMRMLKMADPARYSPERGAIYPKGEFGRALLQIAQLIKSDVGLEIAFAEIGGWDTHANQGTADGQLAGRLRELGDGIAALYNDLGDRMRNVVIMTMTEFGRTLGQNGSGGTDHGHASSLFVLGGPVRGGQVHGIWPGLAPEQLHDGRDLALTTDFRAVFGEVASRHLGAGSLTRIFPGLPGGAGSLPGLIGR